MMATGGQLPALSVAFYKINPCCALSGTPIEKLSIYEPVHEILEEKKNFFRMFLKQTYSFCFNSCPAEPGCILFLSNVLSFCVKCCSSARWIDLLSLAKRQTGPAVKITKDDITKV